MPRRRKLYWPFLAGGLGIAIVVLAWLGYL